VAGDEPHAGFRHSQQDLAGASIHVVEAGDRAAPSVMFLHGWPESWFSWRWVMELASDSVRAVAIDLPGILGSTGDATDGSKRQLAGIVHELIATLGLEDVTLMGQDIGGMITYAYLSRYDDIERALIKDVVVPGLGPWERCGATRTSSTSGCTRFPGCPNGWSRGDRPTTSTFFYQAISARRRSLLRHEASTPGVRDRECLDRRIQLVSRLRDRRRGQPTPTRAGHHSAAVSPGRA
jgi:pimeloyl-ACP methyl ester carboxylesterase